MRPRVRALWFLRNNLSLGATFEWQPSGLCSAHDDVDAQRRDSCIGRAACERAIQLCFEPLVSTSCGAAMGPAASFAFVQTRWNPPGRGRRSTRVHRGGVSQKTRKCGTSACPTWSDCPPRRRRAAAAAAISCSSIALRCLPELARGAAAARRGPL